MGKFANKLEGLTGAPREQIKLPWNGESGFAAMGHKVPAFRKSEAERHMKEMGWIDSEHAEKRYSIVAGMAAHLERDNSHEALEFAMREGVDATGCYRLMAVLLTATPADDGGCHTNQCSKGELR